MINQLVLMQGQGGSVGITVQPVLRVLVPSEAQAEGDSQLRGTLQQLLLLVRVLSQDPGRGGRIRVSWWGRQAMTSLWGPGSSGPWQVV